MLVGQEKLQKLVLAERVEIVTPLTYILLFLMAYYGPNAKILGGIKLTIWHYQAVTDLEMYLGNIGLLFAFDSLSGIICFILLWQTCRINMFNILQNIQKLVWINMAFQEAMYFIEVKYENHPD